jgi:hypothetical protein
MDTLYRYQITQEIAATYFPDEAEHSAKRGAVPVIEITTDTRYPRKTVDGLRISIVYWDKSVTIIGGFTKTAKVPFATSMLASRKGFPAEVMNALEKWVETTTLDEAHPYREAARAYLVAVERSSVATVYEECLSQYKMALTAPTVPSIAVE